jgi:hypothetical protein
VESRCKRLISPVHQSVERADREVAQALDAARCEITIGVRPNVATLSRGFLGLRVGRARDRLLEYA